MVWLENIDEVSIISFVRHYISEAWRLKLLTSFFTSVSLSREELDFNNRQNFILGFVFVGG